ncbi:MAG: ABC transporter ATP-binding protein [Bacilli bacterium]|nr:ABC transporter ATP-binding protein [Bacilli bacterium]
MKYAILSLRLLLKKYPYDLLIQAITIIISTVVTIIPIYMIDQIVRMVQDNRPIEEMMGMILLIALVFVAANIIGIFVAYYDAYIERNFKAECSILFFKKLDQIDYDFHESPKFLNDYTRALEDGTERIYRSAIGVIAIVRIVIQSLSVFVIIFTMHYMAVVYAIGIGIIYLFLRFQIGHLNYKAMSLQRPFMRQRGYVNRTFFIKDSMADLKTTQIEEILLENNAKANDEIVKVVDDLIMKKTIISYIGDILIASIYPITLGVLAYVTIEDIEIASFASLTVAATTLSTLVSQFVSAIGDLQNHTVECRIPFEVLNMKSKIEGIAFQDVMGDFSSLEVQNASFSYDKEHLVLDKINLHINKGEKIAIVGSNGAGKTTLVKLLLRLYDTTDGDIYINNQNYKQTTAKSLREKVGAVFQNVEVYAVSIAENILFRKPQNQSDIDLIHQALQFSGLDEYINSLEEGINTQVTREFNRTGAIFSGGQMQRLAIARGFAQNYQLFILDEPSSALDPLSEAQVYQNMMALGREKTIIFISHRLTTTVNADRIYLFEQGQIIEAGNHQELMALNGVYKKMFQSQASKYLGENDEDN